ncbi:MAG: PAS domain S-box protein [Chloroflexota bacterium]
MKPFPSPTSLFDPFASRDLQEWREYILEGILRGILAIWIVGLLAGINNVYQTYQIEAEGAANPLFLAALTLTIYVGTTALLAAITFARKVPFTIRAGSLLFIFYALGSIGLVQSSLSGDGRIFLFAFVILSAVFLDLRYSLTTFFISLITMIVVGWLQVNGHIIVPPARQINSVDGGAWVSGTVVFLILSIAILISITYLLGVLGKNLERSRELLAREQRLSRLLRTLSDVNQLIVREQDAARILQRTCEILIVERGYIFSWISLLAADGVTLNLASSAGETIDSTLFTTRLDGEGSGPSCVATAVRSKQPFLVEPAENDPCPACPLLKKYPRRSSLALPIVREARIFGVLTVVHPSPSGIFDAEEINLLTELADDLAYALEKIESEQRILTYARHQALLNEITQTTLETPNLEAMLEKFIAVLEKALSADGFYFSLWDESAQQPGKFISSEMFKVPLSLYSNVKPGEKIFSRSILESGQVLAVEDIRNSVHISPHLAALFPAHSALGLPLIANDRKLGTLVFGFREHHQFSMDEVELAEQAARQIALSMVKAGLDADIRTKAAELEQLYAAAQDMTASIMDPHELLAKLARHMTEALQATSGNIMAVNLADGTMQVVGEYWAEEASSSEVHQDLGQVYLNSDYATIMIAMQDGEVVIMHADDEVMSPVEREQFAVYGIKSMMFVPIMAHGQLFGDIEIWESRRRREFTPADIRLAKAMAGHAAFIIENANLVNEVRMSETRYRTLVEQASDGIFLADTERRYVDVNPSGCAMLGYSREELLAMRMDDIISSEELSAVPFRIEDLRAGKILIVERLLKRKDGSPIPVEISARMLPNGFLQGIVRDISERKRVEKALAEREAYFRVLIENSAEGVVIVDGEGIARYIAPSGERLTGYTPEEILGQSAFRYIHPQDIPRVLETFAEGAATPGVVRTTEYRFQRKDGEWRHFEVTGHNMLDDPYINGIVANYRDITERKQMNIALRESEEKYRRIYENLEDMHYRTDYHGILTDISPSVEKQTGYKQEEVIGHNVTEFYAFPEDYNALVAVIEKKGSVNDFEARLKRKDENLAFVSITAHAIFDAAGQPISTEGIIRTITERKQAEDALKASEMKFRTLAENIPSVVYLCKNDERYTFLYLNDSIEELSGHSKKEFLEEGLSFFDLYHPDDLVNIPLSSTAKIATANQGSFHITYRIRHTSGEWRWVDEWGAGVADDAGNVQYIEGVMVDITERKRAEDELRHHAHELEALAAASAALRTAQSVTEMVPVLAKQAMRAVAGDYGSIFLLDSESGDYVSHGWFSARGESKNKLKDESILRHRPGEGITGHVAITGEIYVTEDMQKDPVMVMLDGEKKRLQKLHGGISLPLHAQEKIIGVLHIWMFERHIFSETEIRILIAFAETAGNAIHRAMLFEQTLQHADELALAYDNTLAGWARALELRDEITEGHTRRVTELTLKFAHALKIPENEIEHIRRGALLHDIGKMGIPDSILHKPGPFTAQERTIMQQHTQYAYDMLSSISFLQPAIDIPFCHHEYWNGAGYPRGLKGEQIPLSARIFSIIDVWDALTSDRPYRKAWSKKKTREYIIERAGKQFDPRIVEVFFSLEIE